MKPEIVKKISPEIALELMNDLIQIHNYIIMDREKGMLLALFNLGTLVESFAERVRSETESP